MTSQSQLDAAFGRELKKIISDTTIEIVEMMFGYKLCSATPADLQGERVASFVTFTQGEARVKFCMTFEKPFIQSLIRDIYPEDVLSKQASAIYQDTASELTNIICNRIKAYINGNGFDYEVSIPEPELTPAPEDNPDFFRLGFSMEDSAQSDNVLYLNVRQL